MRCGRKHWNDARGAARAAVGAGGGVWLVLAACLAAQAAAEAPPEAAPAAYTLEQCMALGLTRAGRMEKARADEAIAEARIGQVRAQIFPELSTTGDYTRRDKLDAFDTGAGSVEFGRLDNYSLRTEVSQLLYSGGSVRSALRAAKAYRAITLAQGRRTRDRLARDIRVSFYDVLLAQEKVQVQASAVEQFEKLAQEAELKFRQETVSEFDWLSARVRLANARPDLIEARKQYAVSRAAFRDLVRLDEEDFRLDGALAFVPSELSLDTLMQRGLARRPELEELRQRLALSKADIRAEQGHYRPTLRATAAYQGQNPESFASNTDSWDWRWDAGVHAEWKLFDGSLRRNLILEKELEAMKFRIDLDEVERAIRLEIRTAYLDWTHAAESVAAGRETVALAEKSLEIAQTRYRAGLSTYLEYTDANVALLQARLAWFRALQAHQKARADLQYACGENDEDPKEP